jgi:hypothetical protein
MFFSYQVFYLISYILTWGITYGVFSIVKRTKSHSEKGIFIYNTQSPIHSKERSSLYILDPKRDDKLKPHFLYILKPNAPTRKLEPNQ